MWPRLPYNTVAEFQRQELRKRREQIYVSQVQVMLSFRDLACHVHVSCWLMSQSPPKFKGWGNRLLWLFLDSIIYHSKFIAFPSHLRGKKENTKNDQEWEGEVGSVKTIEDWNCGGVVVQPYASNSSCLGSAFGLLGSSLIWETSPWEVCPVPW